MLARVTTLLLILTPASSLAQNSAPSSHMVFDDNFDGGILINRVRIPKSGEATYSYYETLGWSGLIGGYAGIQAHPKGHIYIFSIWDHKSHAGPIKAAHLGAGTTAEKFGGEGTGLKTWNFKLGWETDVWYTTVLRCWPVGDHTHVGFWVHSEKTGEWTHLATLDVATKGAHFQGGTDVFIEDWLSTGATPRTMHFREGWKRKTTGEWHALSKARYSVNAWDLKPGKRSFNFRANWNGGVARDKSGQFYFMTSGGNETKPSTENPSQHSIARPEKEPDFPPLRIGKVGSQWGRDGSLTVGWHVDPKAAPRFGYTIEVRATEGGEVIAKQKSIAPEAQRVKLTVPREWVGRKLSARLRCRDILGRESQSTEFAIKGR